MSKFNMAVRVALAATALTAVAAPSASAAQVNQLCKTTRLVYLSYSSGSGTGGVQVPVGSFVRILAYSGPSYYSVRYQGALGDIDRSAIDQQSCRF